MSNREASLEGFKCFSVCLPDSKQQFEYSVTKFSACHKVDFANCPGGARIERENNLREFKSAHDIDLMPKSGAGSEYGREQREEARKKKYGIRSKHYNPCDQPWVLKLGTGKQQRRFKGTKNGGVSKNAAYMGFVPVGNSKFIAQPMNDWYDFIPLPKYKALNAEEAEEEFSRRDKTFNHFAIMCKRKYNINEGGDDNDQEKESKSKSKGGKKGGTLLISDFDLMSESEKEDSENEEKEDGDNGEDEKNIKKKGKKVKKDDEEEERDDEALEENDDVDEGQEVDYMSASSGDDEDMFDNEAREDKDVYKDAGVAEEEGLKNLVGSDDEEDEEEKKDEKDDDELDKEKIKDSDSGSSSDSDIDSNPFFDLAPSKSASSVKPSSSGDEMKNDNDKKRKSESPDPPNKKPKLEPPTSSSNRSENSMEEIVKRYLLRKPMTTRDLLKKLTSKHSLLNSMSKKQISDSVVMTLKRLKPQSKNIGGLMHFFLPVNN